MPHSLLETGASRGNLDLLQNRTLALFCSVRCPGNLILRTHDFVCSLRDPYLTVISGFHSPIEKECLTILLRRKQALVICPARSIETMRIPKEWKQPLEQGQVLLLSPFEDGPRRATEAAGRRNDMVASLADEVFVAHAAPGSKTEAFCRGIMASGHQLLTLDSPYNAALIALGAIPLRVQQG